MPEREKVYYLRFDNNDNEIVPLKGRQEIDSTVKTKKIVKYK